MNAFLPPSLGTAQETDPARAVEWRGTGCILVVDDEDPIRTVVSRAVTRLGFTSKSASNGRDALALFESDPAQFAVAVVDVKMPVMDGMEIMRRLRLVRPDLPVILMSGYNKVDVAGMPPQHAVTGYLHKPFTLDSLASELRAVTVP